MEFKRLSDVEVVAEPTESANVLIEENGVIKKAPKTAVGGAGGAGNTIIFAVDSSGVYGEAAPEGLYEKLNNMFNNGICVDIVPYFRESLDNGLRFIRYTMSNLYKSEDIFNAWFDNYHLQVYPNNTMDFYYDD